LAIGEIFRMEDLREIWGKYKDIRNGRFNGELSEMQGDTREIEGGQEEM
jgi:hypothetical protein